MSRIRRRLLPPGAATDPLDAIELARGEPAFYFRSDQRGIEIAGLGAVALVDAGGSSRFTDARRSLERLRDSIDCDEGVEAAWPLVLGGFAFDESAPCSPWEGFPALRLFVPRVLWVRERGELRTVVATPAGRAQTPLPLVAAASCGDGTSRMPHESDAAWLARVRRAVDAIRAGQLEKVVLSRRRTVAFSSPIDSALPLVRALAEARPSCFTFLVRWAGRSYFGSSPERLVRLQAGAVEADALAGSAARGHGAAHDDALARELLGSVKERREHRIVADAIGAALAPLAGEVVVPEMPRVLRLPEAQHLHTPLRARLAGGSPSEVLDLVAAVHPTPAVSGAPREIAHARLADEEPERGWYGGGIGWIGADGDGDFAVALRAALVDGDAVHVWAGAGIVEGSSPERELDETERKMTSLLPYIDRFAPSGGDRDECAA